MSNQAIINYPDLKKKQVFWRMLKSWWLTDESFFIACMNAYLNGKIAIYSHDWGVEIIDDTDIRYYQNDWFIPVNETVDSMLNKIRALKNKNK